MKKIHLSLFVFLLSLNCFGQSSLFQNGDKIAFVGNSITNNGEFHHNIFQYYVTRFPQQPITFFNCGISGDITSGILNRMDMDILTNRPTHVVLMIGMNDVKRNLYGAMPTQDVDTLKQRAAALTVYKTNLDSIIRIFLSKDIKVILQKPTIYDQTAILKTANNLGVNDALKKCADYIEELAQKYHLPVVDYWTILNSINHGLQKEDPMGTIIGADRVHPAAAGHLIMAYQFLNTLQPSSPYIAKICIKKNIKSSQKASKSCKIGDLSKGINGISFSVKENALPFPTVANQKQALDLVPFIQDLNLEELKVMDLKQGDYSLLIDTTVIGIFTAEQFKVGVNLALYPHSPQYQQALAVRKNLMDMWVIEANLRTIRWVEIGHLNDLKNKQDLDSVKIYLDKRFHEKFEKLSNGSYYKGQFEKYVLIKPNELKYNLEKENLRQKAYELAQNQVHNYRLILR